LKTPNLKLYYFDACPFCQMVLHEIKKLSVKVDLLNTYEDKSHKEKLIDDTGRKTVPCMYIDEKPMHESSDIIAWLHENIDNLEKI
jgi:glutaredoxin 3